MPVKPIPDGFHTITPYLVVHGAARLIDFLKEAFDAEVLDRMEQPDGTVNHAQLKIGDSMIMMGEGRDEWKPMPCSLYMYVTDTDALYAKAMAAGGESIMEPTDHFYGDRNAGVKDPSGNTWWIATHQEDVPPDELRRRAEAHHHKHA